MNCKTPKSFDGYALYCSKKKPLGVVSPSGDRQVLCNIETLPNQFKKYLVAIEDQRFYNHGAIDIKGITRAAVKNLKSGKIVQGGSTITQQLARNILKDNRKSIFRKIREIKFAFELEKQYSKDEILNLYFDRVFWGKKIYGIRTASLEYFAKEPENLAIRERLALITLLRGPNYYIKHSDLLDKRCELMSRILYEKSILNTKNYRKVKKSEIEIKNTSLEVFRNKSIPFISTCIKEDKRTILTTLNAELQREVTKFINTSKYATSILAIRHGQVIGVGSSNGTDYPFTFKSNVGSTLKPFIYSILRNGGIKAHDVFRTISINELNWEIREVQNTGREFLSLEEALFYSNNNCFVNATFEFGIEKILQSLSELTNKPLDNYFPSSVLGATLNGLSLYELVMIYDSFFKDYQSDPIKSECVSILEKIAFEKFNGGFHNSFLKTGTTNLNKERFAILGYANTFFGFLRQGNEQDDYSKDGGFISNIMHFLQNINKKVYKW